MDLSDALHDASGTRAALELRVLSGRQSGARALLPSDGVWTRLGRLDTNDLVLRDAPFDSVEVGLQDGQWWWRQADGAEVPLESGQGVRFGDFVLQMSRLSSPWLEELPTDWAIDEPDGGAPAPAVEKELTHNSADEPLSASALDAPAPTQAEEEPDAKAELPGELVAAADTAAPVAAPARVGHFKRVVVSVGALSVLATAFWILGVSRPPASAPTGAGNTTDISAKGGAVGGASIAPVAAPSTSDLDTVNALLAGASTPAPGLRAVAGPEGQVVLKGTVRDDEALEVALRPLIRAGVRVSMQVLTAREFDIRAQALSSQLPKGLAVQALGDGTLKIQGELASAEILPELQALAAQEVPEALRVEWSVSTVASRQELERQAQLVDAQRVSRLPPVAPLPDVMSVIGGADAHIVLADGLRVSTGGTVGVWRLVTVADSAITFVDPHGRQRRMAL
jgi:hypothetical protein